MRTEHVVLPLALLSAAFLLGCQEQGSNPVAPSGLGIQAPDGLGIQAATGGSPGAAVDSMGKKPEKKPKQDKNVNVTLTGGMVGMLMGVKVFSDNGKQFAMNTGSQSSGTITTQFSFDLKSCLVENGTIEDDRVKFLFGELNRSGIPVVSPSLFLVQVDRRNNTKNDLQVTYDDGNGPIILGWAHRDPPTVTENPQEVFTFTGGQIRVGEDEGRDRIRILCPKVGAFSGFVKVVVER